MDFRIIGIWGIGGIGKTTLASIVFERYAYSHFDGRCFLKDVPEGADTYHLRDELFSQLVNDKNVVCTDTPAVGSGFIQDRLCYKKVFIVLDNLNGSRNKLKVLLAGYHFANGSRIIVTTRDMQLLQTENGKIFELTGLSDFDALKLFCSNAFGQPLPATGYESLSERIADYTNGNPLALEVLGCSLKSKDVKYWESALAKLKTSLDPDIQKVLRISFDGLHDKGIQGTFLDMACFFPDFVRREVAERILNRTEQSDAAKTINDLVDKSLIKELGNFLKMHDLLRQMGQGIVFDENNDPGKRSRLLDVKDVCIVLERNTGTSTIEGILLNLKDLKKDVKVSSTAFSNMYNLRFLKIKRSFANRDDFIYAEEVGKRLRFPSGLESFVSDEIRYFRWDFYPSKYLPYLSTENLVVLTMRNSQLERLWNEDQPLELEKLKKIDLSFSTHLIQIPNLSRAINLQVIYLEGCTSLVHIPPFFQNLNKLQILYMTDCENLEDGTENLPNSLKDLRMGGTAIKSLPESIGEMKYLEKLELSYCENLSKISEISNQVKCLSEISLSGAEIEELPEAIESLTLLRTLDLSGCYKIKFLPKNLCELSVLRRLILDRCSSLEELPPLPRGLDELGIRECERLKSIAELPSSLCFLYANGCRSLETISSPGSPPKPPFRHSFSLYWFPSCLKLDEDARNNVIADRARLLTLSGQDDGWYSHRFMYPGDEIPEWFSYQTDGGNSINIHLPPNWFEPPFRFAFCIVLNMLYNEIKLRDLTIRYEFNFKTNTSNSDDHLHNYDMITNFHEDSIVDSDHVVIVAEALSPHDLSKVFGPNWYSMSSNITEASFRVSLTSLEYDHVDTIKKFGFRFCNADYGFEKLNVDRAGANQPNGHKHNGDSLPHNNSKRIKLMG